MLNIRTQELIDSLCKRDATRSEATLQSDVRRLLLTEELQLDEDKLVSLETQAGQGRRIDVEVGATVIEVKKSLQSKRILEDASKQLQGYVDQRQQQFGSRYVGVLTDGAAWHCYYLKDKTFTEASSLQVTSGERDGEKLLFWLEGVLATTKNIPPTPENIEARIGAQSSSYELDSKTLKSIYLANKDKQEIQTKRNLWSRLLTAALGTQFQDSDDLFVEHTLLVNSAEIIAHAVLGLDVEHIAPASLLSGAKFDEHGIHGVVEADFFDWVVFVKDEGPSFVRSLARRLSRFDWSKVEHDILKVLYESIISTETRKKMGEYYTPDWLAQKMIEELIKEPLSTRVLDPSCGSGTFLFHAVRRYLEAAKAANLPTKEALRGVTQHVFGMELHPVAVTLARVTYLLAIGKELLATDRDDLRIPVFLGDSMQWQQKNESLWSRTDLLISTNVQQELFSRQGNLFGEQLRFPRELLKDSTRFDAVVQEMASKAADEKRGARPSLTAMFRRQAIPEAQQEMLSKTFQTMCKLYDEGRDHIWGYYVRNLVRPQWLSLKDNRVDLLIGNPPWLSYRFMPQDMQASFREMNEAQNLWQGAKVATQQDLSCLFVARTIQLYLKDSGRFGFVMPISVLDRKQYAGFRKGEFKGEETNVNVHFSASWDLRRVKPAFFPVSASVVVGARAAQSVAMPTETIHWSGKLTRRDAPWSEAEKKLKITNAQGVITQAIPHESPYSPRFRQGATILPRVLFMVEKQQAGPLGQVAGKAHIKSVRSSNEKEPWKSLPAQEGVIETEFLRSVHLGETLLQYRTLEPPLVVLPRDNTGLMDGKSDRLDDYKGLAKWWKNVEELWMKNRSSERLTLIERLDFHKGISNQFPIAAKRVVYNASGQYIAASRLNDTRAVIEHKLYWASVASDEEAYYLCAILNAAITTKRVQPLMSFGQHNERDIDKYVWQLPIPLFDVLNTSHQALAVLGKLAEEEVAKLSLDGKKNFTVSRRLIRDYLETSEVGREIEEAVEALLSGKAVTLKTPEQSLLSGVSSLLKNQKEQAAIDLIIERIDDWFLAGEFARVDQWLALLKPTELTSSVLLAVLSAVHPGREKLTKRAAFFTAAREVLHQQLKDKERVARLVSAWQ